jgi:hypothetical protein
MGQLDATVAHMARVGVAHGWGARMKSSRAEVTQTCH